MKETKKDRSTCTTYTANCTFTKAREDGKSVGFLWSQGGDQFEMEEAGGNDSRSAH